MFDVSLPVTEQHFVWEEGYMWSEGKTAGNQQHKRRLGHVFLLLGFRILPADFEWSKLRLARSDRCVLESSDQVHVPDGNQADALLLWQFSLPAKQPLRSVGRDFGENDWWTAETQAVWVCGGVPDSYGQA